MSDAQLLLLLRMILTKLGTGIDALESGISNILPDPPPVEFKTVTGGTNLFLDPERIDYPILRDLYELRNDLIVGIEEMEKPRMEAVHDLAKNR